MIFLLLCILCNVFLAVIFKYFAHFGVNNLYAIIINYFVCVIASSIFLGEFTIPYDLLDKEWLTMSLLLASLFIVGFNVLALSFQKAGVALTIIIQKMSLVIPSAFAIALYGESLPVLKILGMVAAIIAIVLVNLPNKKGTEEIKLGLGILMLPILTFLLSGIIEIILFYTEASGKLKGDDIQFTATSFGLAGLMGLIYSFKDMILSRRWINIKDVVGGVILGLPNYLTIYLLVYLLAKGWDGSVLFPLNNIGILICTSLVGVILFREQLESKKLAGLILGGVAILLIGMS